MFEARALAVVATAGVAAGAASVGVVWSGEVVAAGGVSVAAATVRAAVVCVRRQVHLTLSVWQLGQTRGMVAPSVGDMRVPVWYLPTGPQEAGALGFPLAPLRLSFPSFLSVAWDLSCPLAFPLVLVSRPFASKRLLAGAVAVAGAVTLAARAADGGCVLQVWWVASGAAPMFCIAVMRVSSRGTPASTSIGGGGVETRKI